MKSRIISATIAVIYLIAAYVTVDAEAIWMIGLYLILPLACIWYSEAVGGYTGLNFGTGPSISQEQYLWIPTAIFFPTQE